MFRLRTGRSRTTRGLRPRFRRSSYVIEKGGRLILASHLGRPKGKPEPKYSLNRLRAVWRNCLGKPVQFAPDCVGRRSRKWRRRTARTAMSCCWRISGSTRKKRRTIRLSRKNLPRLCDVYVNDAFGTAHRAHASTAGIAQYVKQAAAGFLMQKEIESPDHALTKAEKPYVAIVGGAKISDKIELIENFMNIADTILIGGAMAYTFLRAQGIEPGNRWSKRTRSIWLANCWPRRHKGSGPIELPVDHVVASGSTATESQMTSDRSRRRPIAWDSISVRKRSGDIREIIRQAKTIVWNGPMGVFENPRFARELLRSPEPSPSRMHFRLSAAAIRLRPSLKPGVESKITHISTGGGASLEFLSGQKLPGVEVLTGQSEAIKRRRPIIAGNWKMFKTVARDAGVLSDALIPEIQDVDHCDIVVAPPFTALAAAAEEADGTARRHFRSECPLGGAGRIHRRNFRQDACGRRLHVHRSSGIPNGVSSSAKRTRRWRRRRVRRSRAGLKAIVCVGETLTERDAGQARKWFAGRCTEGLGQLTDSDLSHIIVAYEPVWAIGTGRTATPEIAAEMHAEIRKIIRRNLWRSSSGRASAFCMAEASSPTIFRH